jgi:hypothetical protein
MVGFGGALAGAPNNEAALGMFGQAVLGAAGVPNVGLMGNAITGNLAGTVNLALSAANPPLGALNNLMGMLTGKTLGSLVAGGSGGDAGTPGQSDVSNATGIEGLGFSDAAFGPPDSPSDPGASSDSSSDVGGYGGVDSGGYGGDGSGGFY